MRKLFLAVMAISFWWMEGCTQGILIAAASMTSARFLLQRGKGWVKHGLLAVSRCGSHGSLQVSRIGSYYGTGYFGNGSGTYTASGKTINTYVDGQPYYTYTVKSMPGNDAELTALLVRITSKTL